MPLVVKDLSHTYMAGTPLMSIALKDVSFEITDGEFIGVIGHTGSGKSTLIQHLNGLIKADSGTVVVDGMNLSDKSTPLKEVRRRVGLVFQYPEYQLFEETVEKDVGFGPKNLGLDQEEIDRRVHNAILSVGMPLSCLKKSPFDLSGGQKRRVAMAGVLAMEPNVLVLDEPTAGLDPIGREEILALVKRWHEDGRTIVMVSHSMDDVARYATRILVMNHGTLALEGDPRQVFSHQEELSAMGLDVPEVTKLCTALRQRGFDLPDGICRLPEMEQALLRLLKKEGSAC